MECVGYLNVANGQKSLLDLLPDVRTIFDSEVFEANTWTLNILMMMVILVSKNQQGIHDVIKETSHPFQSTMSGC